MDDVVNSSSEEEEQPQQPSKKRKTPVAPSDAAKRASARAPSRQNKKKEPVEQQDLLPEAPEKKKKTQETVASSAVHAKSICEPACSPCPLSSLSTTQSASTDPILLASTKCLCLKDHPLVIKPVTTWLENQLSSIIDSCQKWASHVASYKIRLENSATINLTESMKLDKSAISHNTPSRSSSTLSFMSSPPTPSISSPLAFTDSKSRISALLVRIFLPILGHIPGTTHF